jgi:hypothetical protein
MQKNLVVLFDILGFSSVMERDLCTYQENILTLLENLKKAEGNFVTESSQINQGITRHSLTPAISAFSDHVVLSYPYAVLERNGGIGPAIFTLADEAAGICNRAIQFGCLIRGGITIGSLYQSGGVVFGPGLVDASKLESKVAVHPRIVLGNAVMTALGKSRCTHPYLVLHDDGIYSLNYIRAGYDKIAWGLENHPGPKRAWIERMRQDISMQIEKLQSKGNHRGLQKWLWFRAQFENFVGSLDPSITGERQSPH